METVDSGLTMKKTHPIKISDLHQSEHGAEMNVACFFRTCQLAHVMDLSSVAVILKDFLKALRSKRHDHGEHLASCLDRQQCWILKGTVFGTEIPILDSKDPQQKIRPQKSGFSGLGAYALRKVASTTSDVFHVLKAAKLKKNLGFFDGV